MFVYFEGKVQSDVDGYYAECLGIHIYSPEFYSYRGNMIRVEGLVESYDVTGEIWQYIAMYIDNPKITVLETPPGKREE